MTTTQTTNRKIVSRILFKEGGDNFRNIFTVEGDKLTDSSIYIIKMNQTNRESCQTEDDVRRMSLQKSLHTQSDVNGKIQTHFKRNGKRFGVDRQYPPGHRRAPSQYYAPLPGQLNQYINIAPENDDIVIKHKPEYFSDISYVFFSNLNAFPGVLRQLGLFYLQKHTIPVKYSAPIYVATAIKMNRLIEIQRQKTTQISS